jgi:hypothetical protein
MITGFIVPASRRARTSRPGRAPVAADLGLVTHAAERHAHELAPGRAGDRLADRGLAGARRADQRQDDPGAAVVGDAAVRAQLAHGQVLRDALLDVVEAGVVGVEHLPRVHRVEPFVAPLRPRHGDQPVEVGADHRGLAGRLAHPLEPGDLALGLLADLVGHSGLLDLGPVLLGHGGVVVAELLADRVHLLAQEVVALLLLGAGLDVVADAAAHLQLGQPVALQAESQLQSLDHVDGLQELDLLLVGEVGGVAGRVGQGTGIGDRAHEGAHAPVVAAQLEDLLDHGAVLALELTGARGRGRLVGTLVDLDPQAALGVARGGAGDAPVEAGQGHGADASRQAHVFADLGHQADVGVIGAMPRDEQNTGLLADVHGQRHVHAREDDGVLEGDQEKFRHMRSVPEIVDVGKYPLHGI